MITMEFVVPVNLCGDSRALSMKPNRMKAAFFSRFIANQIYFINTMQVSQTVNELSMSVSPTNAC
jgi:hypothetical protein